MSWEDQGRQEHGWFGHGTAPPQDGAGASRSGAEDAEAAAAQAYVWAKAYGSRLFGLPKSGAALDEFAEKVRRIEQARPGSIAQALDNWVGRLVLVQRASAMSNDLLTPVQFTRNLDYACRVLRLDRNAASDALHAAKFARRLGPADNCVFDLKNGDILYDEEVIGNLGD